MIKILRSKKMSYMIKYFVNNLSNQFINLSWINKMSVFEEYAAFQFLVDNFVNIDL